MALPTIEEIKNSIEKSRNIKDLKLAGYHCCPGLLGPLFFHGNFGVVFPLENQYADKYAFRVWHKEIEGIKQRTAKIAEYISTLNLPYFIEFEYVIGGLFIDSINSSFDAIRMEWVEGKDLKEYIDELLDSSLSPGRKKGELLSLAANFKKMFCDLHENKISHGDLQHGNVIVRDDNTIVLIDYDSICVPAIRGEKHITIGLSGYQHPIRKTVSGRATEKDDYFSELIIYYSLLILAERPDLWKGKQGYGEDDYGFLFTENDFLDLSASPLFQEVNLINNPEIKELSYLLSQNLQMNSLENIEPLPGTVKDPYISQPEALDLLEYNSEDELRNALGIPPKEKRRGYNSPSYSVSVNDALNSWSN